MSAKRAPLNERKDPLVLPVIQKKESLALSLILLFIFIGIGLWLRIDGLRWGLPSRSPVPRVATYHPDEVTYLKAIRNLDPLSFNFNPGPYNVGGNLPVYIFAISIWIASKVGYTQLNPNEAFYLKNPQLLDNIYLAGRLVSVIFGTLTIPFVFLLGRKLYGNYTGLLASGIIAFSAGHIVDSHYMKADILATFLATTVLYFLTKVIMDKKLESLATACLFLGFGAGAKFSLIILALCFIIALGFTAKRRKYTPKSTKLLILIRSLLFFILAFLLSNPSLLTDPKDYWDGILSVLANQEKITFECIGYSNQWWYYYTKVFPYMFGWILTVLSIFSFYPVVKEKMEGDYLLSAWTIPYFISIGFSGWGCIRYALPLLPGLSVLIARFINRLHHQQRFSPGIVSLIVLIHSFMYSYASVSVLREKDNRDAAAEWILNNIKPGSSIGMLQEAYYWAPPVLWKDYREQYRRFRYFIAEYDQKTFEYKLPDYFVISNVEYMEFLRLKDIFPEHSRFIEQLKNGSFYEMVAVFDNQPHFFKLAYAENYPPHDWRYTHPIIEIYKNKELPDDFIEGDRYLHEGDLYEEKIKPGF